MNQDPCDWNVRTVLVLILTLIITLPATAQTTVGFADPHDLQALLDYRLPTWNYRTWSLSGGLAGGGWDYTGEGSRNLNNRFQSNLASDLAWAREAEITSATVTASVDGGYAHDHAGTESSDRSSRALDGMITASGTVDRYLRPGGLFVGADAGGSRSYHDRRTEASGTDDTATYVRGTRYNLGVSVGLGRVRDVMPLVRARRLSERLAALGRPRLTPAQERQVAEVLAREYGYEAVYDRPDRRFWRDVLQPMLGEGAPLSPYEVLYLREILDELTASRLEGASVSLSPRLEGSRSSGTDGDAVADARIVRASAVWYHNLSLDHQVGADLTASYDWSRFWGLDAETGRASLTLRHLWVLVDRHTLSSFAALSRVYHEEAEAVSRRSFQFATGIQLVTWVEDKLALVTNVRLGNDQRTYDVASGTSRGWQWSYRLGVEYALDRLLW